MTNKVGKQQTLLVVLVLPALWLPAYAGFPDWLDRQLRKPSVSYGYWQCDNCYIAAPSLPKESSGLADLKNFIQANNGEIHSSKSEQVHRWIPRSTITLCNRAGLCITLAYMADTLLWMPVAPSFPKPPGVEPRKAKNQDVSQSDPGGTLGGTIELDPIGLPSPTSQWSVTVPYLPPRRLIPSVTIIQHNTSTTYIGAPIFLDPIRIDMGLTLEWGVESWGLSWGSPGFCYDSSFCDSFW